MKIFRVYFNLRSEAPQVWSIDEGTQESEVNVQGFSFIFCECQSRYNGELPNDDTPVAWIEVEALGYSVINGIAKFYV